MTDMPTPRPADATTRVDDPTVPRQQEPPQPPPAPDEAQPHHPHPGGRPEGVVSDPDV